MLQMLQIHRAQPVLCIKCVQVENFVRIVMKTHQRQIYEEKGSKAHIPLKLRYAYVMKFRINVIIVPFTHTQPAIIISIGSTYASCFTNLGAHG